MKPAWGLLVVLFVAGCAYRERGRAAVVIPARTRVRLGADDLGPVRGKACFSAAAELADDLVISAAIDDALSRAPGANALVDVTIADTGPCLIAAGRAVRVVPALAPVGGIGAQPTSSR